MAKSSIDMEDQGIFWVPGKLRHRLPGKLLFDDFPKVRLFSIGSDTDFSSELKGTIHGLMSMGQNITLLGTLVNQDYWTNSIVPREVDGCDLSFGNNYTIIANRAIIGRKHYDSTSQVRRISFASKAVEEALRIKANFRLDLLKFRKAHPNSALVMPVVQKIYGCFTAPDLSFKIRVIVEDITDRSTEPNTRIVIDFPKLASIDHALKTMHSVRDAWSVICCRSVDMRQVNLLMDGDEREDICQLRFYNPHERIEETEKLIYYFPSVDILASSRVFSHFFRHLHQEEPINKITRRAFVSTFENLDEARISDLRELVTVLEMRASRKHAPLPKPVFKRLKKSIAHAVQIFSKQDTNKDEEVQTGLTQITDRLQHLNSSNAKVAVETLIRRCSPRYIQPVIPDASAFAKTVVDLRNNATHDLSRMTNKSYQEMTICIIKLRWLITIIDLEGLGTDHQHIQEFCAFFQSAKDADHAVWSTDD